MQHCVILAAVMDVAILNSVLWPSAFKLLRSHVLVNFIHYFGNLYVANELANLKLQPYTILSYYSRLFLSCTCKSTHKT
jgi:hypothetical protein